MAQPLTAPQDTGPAPAPRNRGRRRRALIAASLAVLVVAFCATTARLFMFPVRGMPARVDAIVMLGGPGDRFHEALKLASEHRAPYLALSLGHPLGPYPPHFPGQGPGSPGQQPDLPGNRLHAGQADFPCGPVITGVKVICFGPDPPTTQGEAEAVKRLAAKYHWHSVVLVTITPQDSRARLRVERCFSGKVYVMTGSLPAYGWPAEILYEWAATIKAVVFQRSC